MTGGATGMLAGGGGTTGFTTCDRAGVVISTTATIARERVMMVELHGLPAARVRAANPGSFANGTTVSLSLHPGYKAQNCLAIMP